MSSSNTPDFTTFNTIQQPVRVNLDIYEKVYLDPIIYNAPVQSDNIPLINIAQYREPGMMRHAVALELQKALSISHNLISAAKTQRNDACVADLTAVHKRFVASKSVLFDEFLQIQENIARFHAQMHAARDANNLDWLEDIRLACNDYVEESKNWPPGKHKKEEAGKQESKRQRVTT